MRALAINPGSTSTKLALLEAGETGVKLVESYSEKHPPAKTLAADLEARLRLVLARADTWRPFDVIAARGGLIGPVPAGVYAVDEEMVELCLRAPYGVHPANLAAPLARELSRRFGVPAFVVDPPTTDELEPVARISGVPNVPRRSRVHALNLRYVARKVAASLSGSLADTPLIGAHLGGGSSVVRFSHGRIVDTNDALLGEGPFSPNRAGTVPVYGVIEYTAREGAEAAREFFGRNAGFKGLLGTDDLLEIEKKMGDAEVRLTVDAYVLQVAKYMLGMAAAERPQAFFVTGGAARFGYVANELKKRLDWVAPVSVWPGEFEMEALAEGAYRALSGIEVPRRIREVTHGNAGL
ncbi:butyrate kinase [Oceanithermus sp.]